MRQNPVRVKILSVDVTNFPLMEDNINRFLRKWDGKIEVTNVVSNVYKFGEEPTQNKIVVQIYYRCLPYEETENYEGG